MQREEIYIKDNLSILKLQHFPPHSAAPLESIDFLLCRSALLLAKTVGRDTPPACGGNCIQPSWGRGGISIPCGAIRPFLKTEPALYSTLLTQLFTDIYGVKCESNSSEGWPAHRCGFCGINTADQRETSNAGLPAPQPRLAPACCWCHLLRHWLGGIFPPLCISQFPWPPLTISPEQMKYDFLCPL